MGFVIFLPYVALVFFIASYILNKKSNPDDIFIRDDFYEDIADTEAGIIIALMAKVAKVDGRVSELEAELIKNTLNDLSKQYPNSSLARNELKEVYKKEKNNLYNVSQLARKYFEFNQQNYQNRLFVLEYLLNLAFIDGEFSRSEAEILYVIAEAFEIDDFEKVLARFKDSRFNQKNTQKSMDLDDAYELLGVKKEDDMGTIKKKYRALVRKYHPDILASEGLDAKSIQEATSKLQKINEAYKMVQKYAKK